MDFQGFSVPIGTSIIRGGAAGEHTVIGHLAPGDTLLAVTQVADGSPPVATDLTAEFSITAGKHATIENTTTDTTGDFLIVTWAKTE